MLRPPARQALTLAASRSRIGRASTFDFVVNLNTARDFSLAIPPSVLQQATDLIQ